MNEELTVEDRQHGFLSEFLYWVEYHVPLRTADPAANLALRVLPVYAAYHMLQQKWDLRL